MIRIEFPYDGSFQRGRFFRAGNPETAAWKHIQRIGTLDNLRRIAERSNINSELAEIASLRIRQSIELRDAAASTSLLSRPLLQYYSFLNLVRGALIVRHGESGTSSHGMRYRQGKTLLSCQAEIAKDGTFPRLIESIWGSHAETTKRQSITLVDLIAQIPELRHEFHLVGIDRPSIAEVHVNTVIKGDTTLRYYAPGIDEEDFSNNWSSYFYWFAEECELSGPFSIRVKAKHTSGDEVAQFCERSFWRDLRANESPVWFDHVFRPEKVLLPRVANYLAALFILSNIARYEPEILMPITQPTDLAFVIESLLDCADRCIPLLIIELLEGPTYFI